jgi:hypothetical protein
MSDPMRLIRQYSTMLLKQVTKQTAKHLILFFTFMPGLQLRAFCRGCWQGEIVPHRPWLHSQKTKLAGADILALRFPEPAEGSLRDAYHKPSFGR